LISANREPTGDGRLIAMEIDATFDDEDHWSDDHTLSCRLGWPCADRHCHGVSSAQPTGTRMGSIAEGLNSELLVNHDFHPTGLTGRANLSARSSFDKEVHVMTRTA
jgi:hypothetical protein